MASRRRNAARPRVYVRIGLWEECGSSTSPPAARTLHRLDSGGTMLRRCGRCGVQHSYLTRNCRTSASGGRCDGGERTRSADCPNGMVCDVAGLACRLPLPSRGALGRCLPKVPGTAARAPARGSLARWLVALYFQGGQSFGRFGVAETDRCESRSRPLARPSPQFSTTSRPRPINYRRRAGDVQTSVYNYRGHHREVETSPTLTQAFARRGLDPENRRMGLYARGLDPEMRPMIVVDEGLNLEMRCVQAKRGGSTVKFRLAEENRGWTVSVCVAGGERGGLTVSSCLAGQNEDGRSAKLFIALCRRYGIKPYRYRGQRRTT